MQYIDSLFDEWLKTPQSLMHWVLERAQADSKTEFDGLMDILTAYANDRFSIVWFDEQTLRIKISVGKQQKEDYLPDWWLYLSTQISFSKSRQGTKYPIWTLLHTLGDCFYR